MRIGFGLVLCGALVGASAPQAQEAKDEKQDAAPAPAAQAPPPAAAPPVAAAPAAPMVNEIKIIFDDKAKNDGEMLFTFTPQGGVAKQIRVTIAKKMNGHEAARDAAKELAVALGAGFKVDHYDSDKIKIEGKDKAMFSLTLASLTANGLSVRLK
jgi:pyruvate/2-oxoglutarate dehydrogenase complex dihydrolipoamide acyltransferase (E2) component